MKLPILFALIAFVLPLHANEFEGKLTGEFQPGMWDKNLPYEIISPKTIEPGKEYPLILFLHGKGEQGTDNQAQLKFTPVILSPAGTFEKNPCFVIAPQCPVGAWWGDKTLTQALDLTKEAIKDLPIDKKRVYITGMSMGGFGTWTALAQEPKLFAAAMPLCGGGDPNSVKKFDKVPIWAFHGAVDSIVNVENSRKMVEALKKEHGKITYTEYPGVDHNCWTMTYQNPEIYVWLFEQKKP